MARLDIVHIFLPLCTVKVATYTVVAVKSLFPSHLRLILFIITNNEGLDFDTKFRVRIIPFAV